MTDMITDLFVGFRKKLARTMLVNYCARKRQVFEKRRDVGMAVPKTIETKEIGMAVCRQDMLHKGYTSNP